jgi:hypothetical protein
VGLILIISRATNPELIEQVKSIFPDLGEGFIAACLAVLGGPENVVSILLEGQPLPYPLDLLDRHLGVAWRKREGADRRDDDVDPKAYVAMQKQYIRVMEREQVRKEAHGCFLKPETRRSVQKE